MHLHRAILGLLLLLTSTAAAQPNWGASPPCWPGFGYNSSHTGNPQFVAQPLNRIKWSTTVDTNFTGLAHYGSPMVTPANDVIFPVHTNTGFRVEARRGSDGLLLWTQNTGYVPQSAGWLPVCGSTLTPNGYVAIPDSGGRVILRDTTGKRPRAATLTSLIFYGAANYAANPAAYDNNIRINTPITCDAAGNLYFGFIALGATPINLQGGIARISANGQGSWVTAAAASHDPSISQVALNCAPALGFGGQVLYVAVVSAASGYGYMLAIDTTTLASLFQARLRDPHTGNDALCIEYSSASPTIGPDGDVYFGVFDDGWNNNDRGWMLHFDAKLSQIKTPGAFGWDHTASIVPRACVPSYTGTSSYLLLCKYNNYAGIGNGDGRNRVAILDPNAAEIDPPSGVSTMKVIMSVLGPTAEPGAGPNAVREWCINNAAVDPITHAAMLNSEDGHLYRWDLNTGILTQDMPLISGAGVPYTPTVIGPDGTVYAINNSVLCAVGQ